MGWGATCGNLSTNGRWSNKESLFHINVLELKATFLAVQAFLKHQSNLSVKLRLDNTTAIAYINNQGGTRSPSLTSLTLDVELVPSTEHFDHCRTPSGCPQCSSRQRVANICRLERLEASTTNITTFSQGQRDRPFCHKANQSVNALCELAPRPTCCGHGRIFHRLEPTERLRVPTIQPYPKNINESDKRQREPSTSSPSVANSTLVAITTTTHSQAASTSPRFSSSPRRSIEPQSNPSHAPEAPTSRLDYFQQLCTTAGLSNTAAHLLSSATRQSTNKAYDCAWTKWNNWCNRRKVNPISANVKDILTFLSDQFDSNLQYRTVNVLRSAISSIHSWIESKSVGQHPLVTRLMKGIANERPPKPRYTGTYLRSRHACRPWERTKHYRLNY
jgi:hypothetical protein